MYVQLVDAAATQKESPLELASGQIDLLPLIHERKDISANVALAVSPTPAAATEAPAAAEAAPPPDPKQQQQQQQQQRQQQQVAAKGASKEPPAAATGSAATTAPTAAVAAGPAFDKVEVAVRIEASALLGAPEDSQDWNVLTIAVRRQGLGFRV